MNLLRGKTLQEIHKDLKSLPRKEKNKLFHHYVIEGDIVKVRMLLNSGVNINVKNSNGKTAIITSIKRRDVVMVEFLLMKGADIRIKDIKGNNAVTYAVIVALKYNPIIRLLNRHSRKRNI